MLFRSLLHDSNQGMADGIRLTGTKPSLRCDTINFYDSSYDPGQVSIQSWSWNFGDGSTAASCCPQHRYAADGDYTVHLAVTTADGRTGSTSRVVMVRTHDVAISKFQEPQSGSAGQTRQLTVGISNIRYPDVVQVDLYKSVPGYYENFHQIGRAHV